MQLNIKHILEQASKVLIIHSTWVQSNLDLANHKLCLEPKIHPVEPKECWASEGWFTLQNKIKY